MAKKKETLFIVLDDDLDCFVNVEGERRDFKGKFTKESVALDCAVACVEGDAWLAAGASLTVYKLVPVIRVKKAGTTVERM